MKKSDLMDFFKGLVIGTCMIIPGVSGGTLAIIFNVYDQLINSVASFREDLKGSVFFMLRFCAGAGVGILIFSRVLLYLLNNFHFPTYYFFLGAIIGSIPMLLRKAKVNFKDDSKEKTPIWRLILFPAIGIAIVLSLDFLPEGMINMGNGMSLTLIIGLIIAGLLIGIALVLPGISASHMLVLLGIYETTLLAIKNLDVGFLLPLGISALICTFVLAKVLDGAMKNHSQITFLLIVGFVLGSLKAIFPGVPGGLNLVFSIVTFVAGLAVIFYVTNLDKQREEKLEAEAQNV